MRSGIPSNCLRPSRSLPIFAFFVFLSFSCTVVVCFYDFNWIWKAFELPLRSIANSTVIAILSSPPRTFTVSLLSRPSPNIFVLAENITVIRALTLLQVMFEARKKPKKRDPSPAAIEFHLRQHQHCHRRCLDHFSVADISRIRKAHGCEEKATLYQSVASLLLDFVRILFVFSLSSLNRLYRKRSPQHWKVRSLGQIALTFSWRPSCTNAIS